MFDRLQKLSRYLIVGLFAFAGLILAPDVGYAQGADGSMESPGAKGDVAGDDEFSRELEKYWAVDRDLPVIKDRRFSRENRLEIGLMGGLITTEPFYKYYPVGGRATYHLSDFFGIELEGSYLGGPLKTESDLTNFLASEQGAPGFNPATDTHDQLNWRADILASWSPLYGKFAFLQRKLAHFNLNVAAGLGAVNVQRPNPDRTDSITATEVELALGVGGHFYINDHWLIRMDGRGYIYPGAELPTNQNSFGKQIDVMSSFMLGVSYLF